MSGRAPTNREVAYRLFAAECNDARYSYSESGDERAPNYVVTPTGARVNRLFVVGVLTEVSQAGDSILRARVADPTGAVVVYAGQYQPDAMAVLDSMEPPVFVAVTGKIRTFQPDDSDRVYTSVRPEEISEVTSDTRDRWTVSAAERTLERISAIAAAIETDQTGDELSDVLREREIDPGLAAGIPIAMEQYDTTPAYLEDLQRLALDATRLVAGEIEVVDNLSLAPNEGNGTVDPVLNVFGNGGAESIEQMDAATATDEPVVDETVAEETSIDQRTADTSPDTDTAAETTMAVETDASSGDSLEASEEFDPEEFDPEEFELDEEVREEIEAEYGTEFSTASEVDAPGEAGIETNEPEEPTDAVDAESETDRSEAAPTFDDRSSPSEPEIDTTDTAATGTEREAETEVEPETDAETEDLETLLLDLMHDLDEGDGADRETLIEKVSETAAISPETVEDTIQDALMSGQCYEPDGGKLKPI